MNMNAVISAVTNERTIEAVVACVEATPDGWNIGLLGSSAWLSVRKTEGIPEPRVGDIVTVTIPRVVALHRGGAN